MKGHLVKSPDRKTKSLTERSAVIIIITPLLRTRGSGQAGWGHKINP